MTRPSPLPSRAPRRVVRTVIAVLALLAAGCIPSGELSGGLPDGPAVSLGDDRPDRPSRDATSTRRQLQPAVSCDDLLDRYIAAAEPLVGPWGLGGGMGIAVMEGDMMAVESAAMDDSAGATAAAPALANTGGGGDGDAFSGTNTQEEAVDEPDHVKTDGTHIVVATDGELRVVDVAGEQVVGRMALPGDVWRADLLLQGDDLLILSAEDVGGGFGPVPMEDGTRLLPAFFPARTVVTRVDLSDPTAPRTVGGVRIEGSYVSARMVDGVVRMVMRTEPTGLAFTQPVDGGLAAEAQAREENLAILRASDIDDWVPHVQPLDAAGTAGGIRPLLDCEQIAVPQEPAGLSTLSVLTFDMADQALDPSSGTGVVAAGDTVYSSTSRLVVATSPWGSWRQPFMVGGVPDVGEEEVRTDLHSFDISDPATVRYVGSGSVPGTLLNSFSVDEQDGVYRVATTTQPAWWGRGGAGEESRSQLLVLTEQPAGADGPAGGGTVLGEVGRVGDLGVTERIYAVRYLSPTVAAVVTFRQVDPLYLIDTADPTAPAVRGELKIPGYSAYLHPVGDGMLLGVGQDADVETGQTLGVQASLFDIRDLANPQRVSQVTFGQGGTPVEWDHKAFTWWAPTGQAFIPVELYDFDETLGTEEFSAGVKVVGIDAEAGALTEQGQLRNSTGEPIPGQWFPPAERTIVIGDSVWTLAEGSLARHDLATLQQRSVVPLS